MNIQWYIYCLIGLLILGSADFVKKIIIQKGYDKDIFLALCFILYTLFFGILFFLYGNKDISIGDVMIAIPSGIFDFIIPVGLMAALKYNDSSFTFVSVRLISSFTLLGIGIFYFSDDLSIANIVGFILGMVAIYLLSGFRFGKKYKISKKGILAIIISIMGVTLGLSYFKYFVAQVDIPQFMFLKFVAALLCLTIYYTLRGKWKIFTKQKIKAVFPYAVVATLFIGIQFSLVLPNIFLLGPLSISYKILSYSLAIPIIMSIIFYNEKLTQARAIAFALTGLSLLFFFF